MGYTDAAVRVYVDVLGPLYVVSEPVMYIQCGIHRLRVCPGMELGLPIRPVCYALVMPWCKTRPPRVRELVYIFGCCCYCCVDWCATSLVLGSVRVAVAV